MSRFAFQNATGFLDVIQLNATLLELAESQDGEPKRQFVLASQSGNRANVKPKLWVAGQNVDVPREMCCGLENAVPISTSMSFEYHLHSWAAVKYVHTKELEMAAAYLDRKQETISDSKETTADNSGAQADEGIGTEDVFAAAGGVVLGPYEGQLTATCPKNPRFRITGLSLRRHTGRESNAELYLSIPAQPAVWEKVLIPAPTGEDAAYFKLHLWQLSDQQHAAQQQQQQRHAGQQQQQQHAEQQQQQLKQQQRIVNCLPAKRAAEAGEVAKHYAPAVTYLRHAKSDIKQRAIDIINSVARGAAGAMITPAATTKVLETPGCGQPVALARLAASEHHLARLTAAAAAAQPSANYSRMPERSTKSNIGACNVTRNSKVSGNSVGLENPARWAPAMTQIRRLWPEFNDKLEAQIKRVQVPAGNRAGAEDVSCQLRDGSWVHSIAKLQQMLQQPSTAPADWLGQDCSRDCNQVCSEEHDQDASVDDSSECSSDGVEICSDGFSPDPSEDPTLHAAWWKRQKTCSLL